MIEVREIHESDNMEGFDWFKEHYFDPEFVHILLVLKENGEDKVWCYAWNLDIIEEANITDYIEICLFEAKDKDNGWGTRMVEELKKQYSRIGIYFSTNIKFWSKVGFEWTGTVSQVDGGNSQIMEWKR